MRKPSEDEEDVICDLKYFFANISVKESIDCFIDQIYM